MNSSGCRPTMTMDDQNLPWWVGEVDRLRAEESRRMRRLYLRIMLLICMLGLFGMIGWYSLPFVLEAIAEHLFPNGLG